MGCVRSTKIFWDCGVRRMESRNVQIIKSVQSNCLLLNDALEIELRRVHNEKEVIIDSQCIELIDAVTQYTELCLSVRKELNSKSGQKCTDLTAGEPLI